MAGNVKITSAGATGTTTLQSNESADRTITLPDATDTLVGKATTDTLTNKTLTAPVISAGTATVSPVTFTSGTVLTAATAGVLEYDGTCFYATPVTSARSLNVSTMFSIVPAGDFSLLTTSGVQSAFPTTGDVWTLQGTTAYFFEGTYYITHTTTTCTVALAFATSGSVTSIGYSVLSVIEAAGNGAPVAPVMTHVNQIATTVVTATSTDGWCIRFQGILRMNAGGTITPQVNWSANTTVPVMKVNSFIKFTPLGTNTTNILGNVG